MKILFAVSNENISQQIIKKYESIYKEIVSSKNVYYFNAILKELQKNKGYDRIVISEDLEPFSNNNYEITDNFIFEKLDRISDEAVDNAGEDIPIILIASDRRTAGESILSKLFGIGVYSALLGTDRTIPKLCELINKPRTKKEAKIYYKIDANETNYVPENEENVSEIEIQNILAHYKKLGKNEEKYVESFNSIANQYTDQQLKIIVKFLPIGVKAVLEEKSPKYQQIMAFAGESSSLKGQKPYSSTQVNPKTKRPRSTDQAVVDNGIKIESINSKETRKPTKPVVIPGMVSTNNVRKLNKNVEQKNNTMDNNSMRIEGNNKPEIEDNKEDIIPDLIENIENLVEDNNENITENIENNERFENVGIQEKAHRRGRPKKVLTPEQMAEIEERRRRGRGRPKKNNMQQEQVITNQNNNDDDDFDFDFDFDNDNEKEDKSEMVQLPGLEENNNNNNNDNSVRIMEDEEESNKNTNGFLPGFDSFDDDILTFDEPDVLPGFNQENQSNNRIKNNDSYELSQNNDKNIVEEKNDKEDMFADVLEEINKPEEKTEYNNNSFEQPVIKPSVEPVIEQPINEPENNRGQLQNYDSAPTSSLSGLMTSNKKVVAFVGTSKNGTSFLVNNLADMFSKQGIKTAILDLTKNRNDYYIYTKNEEDLRKTATECINKLILGTAQGVKVNNYLDVYTSMPGDKYNDSTEEYEKVLTTLLDNYSLILLDCDFETNLGYLRESKEIYLVQSMDVLTIQPLTAYLRELKAKNIYEQEKLRIVINKYTRVRSITERTIIGGMAFYNDPSMSFMSDELFNRDKIRYSVIPFDQQTYSKYLEGLVNCNISVNGYSKDMINSLNKLAGMVFPLITGNSSKNRNDKNNYGSGGSFPNQMNDTLSKMKNNY